jgi:hypothetical protein
LTSHLKDPRVKKYGVGAGAVALFLCLLPVLIIILILLALSSFIWLPIAGVGILLFTEVEAYGLGPMARKLFGALVLRLLFHSGPIQNWIWKTWYNFAFRGQKTPEVTCLNYGFALDSGTGVYIEKHKDNKVVF